MNTPKHIGVEIPEILLPNKSVDLQKWAVIACDQFTSEPEYWERVGNFIGDAPSTLRMILPEVWLNAPNVDELIQNSQKNMQAYLDAGLLEPHRGLVLVERSIKDKVQTGLVIALDLEDYDYTKGSQTLIRATEGTIVDRLPPRMKVRRGAALELPHILVLYDDPKKTLLTPLLEQKENLPLLYDLDLMEGSGHLTGRLVSEPALLESVQQALANLIEPNHYAEKYQLEEGTQPLLFAMGDGNHSLATAKAIWEELKPTVGMDHPARYALVELVNLHDPSLNFEAIHRVLFGAPDNFLNELKKHFGSDAAYTEATSFEEMKQQVDLSTETRQRFGMITPEGYSVIELSHPKQNLPAGNLQAFLDAYLKEHRECEIDYVHGDDVVDTLSRKPGNLGFYLPAITKNAFFKSVIVDGTLPRKTFSMGHAEDKRFYMECRRITL